MRRARRAVGREGRAFFRLLFSPIEKAAIARAMRLRGYGNAIVPQVAAEFVGSLIEAWDETITGRTA